MLKNNYMNKNEHAEYRILEFAMEEGKKNGHLWKNKAGPNQQCRRQGELVSNVNGCRAFVSCSKNVNFGNSLPHAAYGLLDLMQWLDCCTLI